MTRPHVTTSGLVAATIVFLGAGGAYGQVASSADKAAPTSPAPSVEAPLHPHTSINDRINAMVDDFNREPPLERGAHDANESSILKGQHGWSMQMILALQRGRWDIAIPGIGRCLLVLAIIVGALSLLSKLFSRRKA